MDDPGVHPQTARGGFDACVRRRRFVAWSAGGAADVRFSVPTPSNLSVQPHHLPHGHAVPRRPTPTGAVRQ
jgi:hypothetical protein